MVEPPKPLGLRWGALGYHDPMGKQVHVLSEVDEEARTATCAHCGPVKFWYSSGRRPTCSVAKRGRRGARGKSTWHTARGGHGLTVEQAQEFREGKVCAICGGSERLCVDHDHRTGMIRGVLCLNCNNGLGRFKDDPALLAAAAKYLGA